MGDVTTTTARRGLMYDVSVTTILSSSLPQQTVFSCSMEIPGTQFSLKKKTMYNPSKRDRARASTVATASEVQKKSQLRFGYLVLFVAYSTWNRYI